ncbi:hypothetical protein [Hymenobacter baengnokdamensis]|uniref:hypothetical protein n=1 Tax=Hymenobacter baengnokdamensis TaxID=2615203 RepID=UPI0012445331|nr:hypothetical protein [Hymenobacter baengnokdamensis]
MSKEVDVISVTETITPLLSEYITDLSGIWKCCYLTNNGPLVQPLEVDLAAELDSAPVQLVADGTIALQLAIQELVLCLPFFARLSTQVQCITALVQAELRINHAFSLPVPVYV